MTCQLSGCIKMYTCTFMLHICLQTESDSGADTCKVKQIKIHGELWHRDVLLKITQCRTKSPQKQIRFSSCERLWQVQLHLSRSGKNIVRNVSSSGNRSSDERAPDTRDWFHINMLPAEFGLAALSRRLMISCDSSWKWLRVRPH